MERKLSTVLHPLRHLGRNRMTIIKREMTASCCTLRLFLARTPRGKLRRRISCPYLTTERHWSMSDLRVHSLLFWLGSNSRRGPPLVRFPRRIRANPLKTRDLPMPLNLTHKRSPAQPGGSTHGRGKWSRVGSSSRIKLSKVPSHGRARRARVGRL